MHDFNAITTGTNGGYNAAAGYNLVTGLGTPKSSLLIPDLVGYDGATTTERSVTITSGNGNDGSGSFDNPTIFSAELMSPNGLVPAA